MCNIKIKYTNINVKHKIVETELLKSSNGVEDLRNKKLLNNKSHEFNTNNVLNPWMLTYFSNFKKIFENLIILSCI